MKEKRKRNASAPSSAPSVVSELFFLSDYPPRYATSFLNGLNLVCVRDELNFRPALELNYHISTSQKLTSNVNVTKTNSNQTKVKLQSMGSLCLTIDSNWMMFFEC